MTAISSLTIRFTADVFTPDTCDNDNEDFEDCECTNVYGEYTEHGYGETMESGWYRSRWKVTDNKEQALTIEPDSFDIAEMIVGEVVQGYRELAKDYRTIDEWVTEHVEREVGCIDHYEPDGPDNSGLGSYYAAVPDEDYYTGQRAMVAAHVEAN